MSKGKLTRLNILSKAFELVYKNGYQTTSVDEIIASTSVTKGAFYHHFKNKDEMGIALIKEVLHPAMHNAMVKPLMLSKNAVQDLYEMMEGLLIHNSFFNVKYGCPAVNLIEEMAAVHPTFNKALAEIIIDWQKAIEICIENNISQGVVKKDVNPNQVATFIISGYSGIRNSGKILGATVYRIYLKELKNYLKTLL
ncbi:TetR/AcrR family transcriptional regulator [Zunongwangia sp. HGR-M22]|uniref:TetR/AcrR family transcriptional regulator n=1 Tax=Zunongwangia sp. HGR-M22 TaxID=3015168 RepID=UPI0022DCE9BA|nr:TetR/AcrR family transcriptional regulator [Zunongwangia sp. HGR-M22]WBL24312.1 TetR/AcrR family transcriptional regulator [Zunongwangia sp. HGR-M22]